MKNKIKFSKLSINESGKYDEALKRVIDFLPYMNSWAVSDTTIPKVFNKNKEDVFPRHITKRTLIFQAGG